MSAEPMTASVTSSAGDTTDYYSHADPAWLQEIVRERKEQGRRVFLLHFNIRDFVFDPGHPPSRPSDLLTVSDFMGHLMESSRSLALYYSLSTGMRLYHPSSDVLGETTFAKATPNVLWEKVARHAAEKPHRLIPDRDMDDENALPEGWHVPTHVMPLLTRAFLHPYEVSSQCDHAGASRARESTPLSIGLIIDSLDHIVPASAASSHDVAPIIETLQRWSSEPAFDHKNHLVVMLAPELAAVHSELRGSDSRIVALRVGRPSRDERYAFLSWLSRIEVVDPTPEERSNYPILREPGNVDKLANQTSGMNFRELLAFAKTMNREWEKQLMGRRADIIQRESGGLLVSKTSRFGLDEVAGYQYAREYVDTHLLHRLRKATADITGILFVGPPGTGKSFFAAALAKDAGVNVVVMRSVRNMYVGESERNLEQVLEVARSLAPVVIFIDEIDQQFSNRKGQAHDGGIEQRLLGRLLEFMDDKENLGKVIWVAASNRPDLIDDALKSRFKVKLPFLLPDRDACRGLLRDKLPLQITYLRLDGMESHYAWQADRWDNERLNELIDDKIVGHYSGRELETIVRRAVWQAEWDADVPTGAASDGARVSDQPILEKDGVRYADPLYLHEVILKSSVPHNEEEYERQSLLALETVEFNSPALLKAVQTALPPQVAAHVITESGLDKDAIRRAIRQLS